jgi:hypothetical protein
MSQVRVSSLPHSLSRPLSETPLARERLLPVHQALAPLFGLASGDPAPLALTRGHTVACVGSAAMSCALAVLVAPTQAGSWAGVVGLPSCGVQAAADLGVSLERTVFVADPTSGSRASSQQADAAAVLSALVDGVDVLLLAHHVVNSLSPSLLRRLQTRVQSRGGILVVVNETNSSTSSLSADIRLTATTEQWQGVGSGHGHLQRRRVLLQLDGRRRARTSAHSVWLPDHRGQLSSVETTAENTGVVIPLRRVG